jgi:hypothetical protein
MNDTNSGQPIDITECNLVVREDYLSPEQIKLLEEACGYKCGSHPQHIEIVVDLSDCFKKNGI